MGGDSDCGKTDAWEAQKERNERYDRMFTSIDIHLGEQTAIMKDIAKQTTQIEYLQKDSMDLRRMIETLFSRGRAQETLCADFRAKASERFLLHELEPLKEKGKETRAERMKASTGIIIVVAGIVLNQLISWINRVGGP
jgi:predicted RNase H-like nuclease (RuvC/YqgF family)